MTTPTPHRFIDIGANLLDSMFAGVYNEKAYHPADLDAVLRRAEERGVAHIIVTASDLTDSIRALRLARAVNASGRWPRVRLHSTVGVHPTSTGQLDDPSQAGRHGEVDSFEPLLAVLRPRTGAGAGAGTGSGTGDAAPSSPDHGDAGDDAELAAVLSAHPLPAPDKAAYVAALRAVLAEGVRDGTVVAVGECGLDYDRLHFASKETQQRHFPLHVDLAEEFGLPMFLHNRNTGDDFVALMREHRGRIVGGVVHSFTGSAEEMLALCSEPLSLYIGINGCSLKTEENLAVAAAVPLSHLLLETDAPWCGVKATHASNRHVVTKVAGVKRDKFVAGSVVKDRNEPSLIVQVAEAVAGARGISVGELADAAEKNTRALFTGLR
jgi:TatD DNase family protein